MAEKKAKSQGKKQEPELSMKMEVAAIIGQRLSEARKGSRLTQSQLAEHVGVVSGYISLAEQGQRLPSVEVLVTWARSCGVSMSDLFSGMEEELHHRKFQR